MERTSNDEGCRYTCRQGGAQGREYVADQEKTGKNEGDVSLFPSIDLKVQDTLFSVSRWAFEKSEVFKNVVLQQADDKIRIHPVIVENIKAEDFRVFLECLYPRPSCTLSRSKRKALEGLSEDKLLAVLRLAKMWGFDEVQRTAISGLDALQLDPVRNIEILHQNEVQDTVWLRTSLISLARRERPLSLSEALRIGVQLAVEVARLREIRIAARFSILLGLMGSYTSYDAMKYLIEESGRGSELELKGQLGRVEGLAAGREASDELKDGEIQT